MIGELAGKPAMERLGEVIAALPENERELASSGVLIGLVIDENRPEYERGDFLVRPIIGADREAGAIAIGEQVRVGQTVRAPRPRRRLGRRGPARGARAPRHRRSARRRGGRPALHLQRPRLPHVRGARPRRRRGRGLARARPTAGFFCAGEIGPVGGRNFLHGFTATMAVFPRLERALEVEQPPLHLRAAAVVADPAARLHHAVAGDDQGDRVVAAGVPAARKARGLPADFATSA